MVKTNTTSDERGSPIPSLSEDEDLDKLNYSEFSGEQLGVLFIEAQRQNKEIAQHKIANQIFETID